MSSPESNQPLLVPHTPYSPIGDPLEVLQAFHEVLRQRRSIRDFSETPVQQEIIEWVVRTAASAPSGANKQPWRFVCVQDPTIKKRIREAAEVEEQEFYAHRAPNAWKADLAPLGTDENKEFLEIAPWLIVVFRMTKTDDDQGVYYSEESVGIVTGMLLAAAQVAGLATLTHTPSPMNFLAEVLQRPKNERAYMLIPVGWPAEDCTVPEAALCKKPLAEIMVVR